MAYLAPAGTAIHSSEILRGFGAGLDRSGVTASLTDELARISGARRCWPVSSGRAAMTVILEAMRDAAATPERDEVIVPAYTCYSVPASIARAGLKPRLCDIDPETLSLDPDALEKTDFSRVLAIVSSNLYGIPNRLEELEAIALSRGAYLLDDAAQCLGAELGGRAVGTFGHAGLYSFDKGKIVCTMQGGAIVAMDADVAAALEKRVEQLPPPTLTETLANAAKLPVYAICLRPSPYALIRRLPFLGLGRTEYEPEYPITRLAGTQAGVAVELLRRLDSLNAARRRVAAELAEALGDLPALTLIAEPSGATPVYARFPVRAVHDRDAVIAALDAAGIGATASYPYSLADVPEVVATLAGTPGPMPGARRVANQIITMPTHGYCPPGLGSRIREILLAGPLAEAAA